MKKYIRPDMVEWISRNWEDRRNAEQVHELVEAIVAELKQDYRAWQRRNRLTPDAQAYWEGIIADVQTQDFWDKMDHLLHFSFDF